MQFWRFCKLRNFLVEFLKSLVLIEYFKLDLIKCFIQFYCTFFHWKYMRKSLSVIRVIPKLYSQIVKINSYPLILYKISMKNTWLGIAITCSTKSAMQSLWRECAYCIFLLKQRELGLQALALVLSSVLQSSSFQIHSHGAAPINLITIFTFIYFYKINKWLGAVPLMAKWGPTEFIRSDLNLKRAK